ncbi:MAG: 3-hydroxyacyl-CoA dehydrogenase NAD-binding domain-containing protein [Tistlia sp.]|uniref:3-hydroxyacyl-CoA dehydrogenase n=1 Tax=Tistlia sp. TaxID=3057121 RepID=UPI0034A47EA2
MKTTTPAITRLGILGAGTMGSGIAVGAALAGIETLLVDIEAGRLEAALAEAERFYARGVEKGRLAEADAQAARARLKTAASPEVFADRELIVEAVFEDFDLKAKVFAELSRIAARLAERSAILATNTSCLRVGDLAAHVAAPGRFLGLHYFSPAQVNPLVEVVRGAETAAATVAAALAFLEATGKTPLLCKDSYGFAVNRFFCPYTNEAARLVDEGLGTTAQVDRVAQAALGVAAGPFLVQNLIKPRINLHAIRNLAPLGPFYEPADFLVRTGDAGESFEIGEDPGPRLEADARIAERLQGATFLPVLQALDEEIASPADIDRGARLALKFGEPPCALMDRLGREAVESRVAPLCRRYGLALPRSLERVGRLLS